MLSVSAPSRLDKCNRTPFTGRRTALLNHKIEIVRISIFIKPRNLLSRAYATSLALYVQIEPAPIAKLLQNGSHYILKQITNNLSKFMRWRLRHLPFHPKNTLFQRNSVLSVLP